MTTNYDFLLVGPQLKEVNLKHMTKSALTPNLSQL
jgi:hypothetical protein